MRTSYLALAVIFLFLALFVGGCATVVSKVADVVAKPVLSLGVADSQTTLAYIEREVAAGRMSAIDAEAAKQCPLSVIALDELRTRMTAEAITEEGFKGLIYYGILNRYGKGVQDEASKYLEQLASSCLPLIPAEKLMKVF